MTAPKTCSACLSLFSSCVLRPVWSRKLPTRSPTGRPSLHQTGKALVSCTSARILRSMHAETRNAGLPDELFARVDEGDDANFYQLPRLVAHIDPGTIAALTQYYRDV